MKHTYLTLIFLSLLIFSNVKAQTGRVGIGESSPGSKGAIKGNLSVGSNYSSQPAPTDGAIIQGRVGIGTSNPNSGAALDIQSSDKGILIPRVNGTGAVSAPTNGMLVYNTQDNKFYYYDGSVWKEMGAGGGGGVTGATGPTGAKGDTGSTGEKGDTGSQGNQGVQGITGATGDQGLQGIQGVQGQAGPQGATGAKGDTGAQGNQGIQGITGATGDQGLQGIQGVQGPAGPQGATGAKGDTGAQGNQGIQGITGATGNQGVQGIQGVQGPAGPQGATGTKGDTGAQGIQGVQGNQGPIGPQGPQGATGFIQNGTAAGQTPYWNGTAWVINHNIFNNGGNVGVGNSSPQHQLNVGTASSDNQGVTIRGYSNSPSNWKGSGAFGYTSATVIMGELNGVAHIGGHNANLTAWSNLVLNGGAGNVGIGIATPEDKLDVNGTIIARAQAPTMAFTGDVNEAKWIQKLGGYMLTFSSDGASTTTLGTGDVTYLGRTYRPKAAFDRNGNAYFAGNVGVGTTNPGNKLTVIRGAGANSNPDVLLGDGTQWSHLNSNSTSGAWSGLVSAGDHTLIYSNGAAETGALTIGQWSGSAKGIRIDAAGNVGVGINSPTERLHTTGNMKADGIVYWGNGAVRTESRDNAGLRGDAGAKSGFFETASPVNYPAGASSWWHLLDVRHSNNNNNFAMQIAGSFFDQNLWFRKTGDNAAQAWSRLLTTNDIPNGTLPAGSLGNTLFHNGTSWTPTSNLYNDGGTIALGNFGIGDDDEWPKVIWKRDVTGPLKWDEGLIKGNSTHGAFGRAGFGIHMHADRHFGFFSTGWDPLFDIEGGSGRAYIKGNTGIGVMNPGAKLDVAGNIRAINSTNPTVSAGGTSLDGMLFDGGGNHRPALVARGTYPHIELWSDVANGNHGPTLRFGGYDNGSSGAFKHWVMGTAGSELYFLDIGYDANASNPHEGISGYAGTTVMRMTNNGYVGIGNYGSFGSVGKNYPDARLEVMPPSSNVSAAVFHTTGGQAWGNTLTVATDGASGDDARINFSYRNKAKHWQIGGYSNSTRWSIWEDGGDGVYGSGWGAERFTVAAGGNVGIGTATPGRKLQVVDGVASVTRYRPNGDWYEAEMILERSGGLDVFPSISFHNPGVSAPQLFGSHSPERLNVGGGGGGWATIAASGFTNTSDLNVKRDVYSLNSGDFEKRLDQIRNIQSIEYFYKNEVKDPAPMSGLNKRISPHLGVAAQSLPAEVVVDDIPVNPSTNKDGYIKGYNLADMDGLLVAGVKALDGKQQQQVKEIETLKQLVKDQQQSIEELKNLVRRLSENK